MSGAAMATDLVAVALPPGCVVSSAHEERRGPAGAARRIVSRPVLFWAIFLCTSKEELFQQPDGWSRRLTPRWGAKANGPAYAVALAFQSQTATANAQEHSGSLKAELSPLLRRSELLLFARAKRSNQEKARPCLRALRATHSGSTPPAGFFDETSLSRRKTACIHARRPSGFSRWLRRCGRGTMESKARATAEGRQLQPPSFPISRCKALTPSRIPFRVNPSQPTARPCHPW